MSVSESSNNSGPGPHTNQREDERREGAWSTLSSRLQPPLPSPFEVARHHICDQIFSAGGARLVLISAPAGFGKTTVMRQVRQRCESAALASAWLNLDPADNDVPRFFAGLSAALEPLMPGISSDTGAAPFEAGGGQFAGRLLERIAKHNEPFILFLDDFEVVQTAGLLTVVRHVIQALPVGAQLVIGSRNVPDLGLGRLRANGWLLEIEPAQLRFTEQEVADFLRTSRQLQLRDDEVKRLYTRTEGWAAALWLASLALSERTEESAHRATRDEQVKDFIARFSGSDTAIADYLAQDVLARLPDDLRLFLLRTSILNPLSAPLCDAVCGRRDSQEQLERLERSQLFLARLDNERRSYRYHGLFAQFLRSQLQRTLPDEVPRLHQAAAAWYEAQGRPVPAIEHALAAGDLDHALPLLAGNAVRLLSDARMMLLSRWLGGIAPEDLKQFPMLAVVHAWAVNFTRGPRDAMSLIRHLDDQVLLDDESLAHFHALKTVLLLRMDRIEDAYAYGFEHLQDVRKKSGFASSVLATALGTLSIIRGKYAEAQEFLAEARRIEAPMGGSFSVVLSESIEGGFDLLRGHLRQAMARLRSTVEPRLNEPQAYSKGNALGGVLLAEALYEADECEEASRLLTGYLPSIIQGGLPDQMITAHILMARLRHQRGEYDQALQSILDLEHLGYRLELPRLVASAKLERARLALVNGNPDAARHELDSAADAELWARVTRLFMVGNDVDTFEIAMFRWKIRAGAAAEVVGPLSARVAVAEGAQRLRRVLKLRILLAAALYLSNERREALAMFGRALKQGAAEGFVRSFTDEGEILAKLMQEWMCSPESAHVAPDYIAKLLKSFGHGAQVGGGASETLAEPLSRKEIVVLRLLAEGFSNRALAQKLFVSETTVRSHLRNINVKLGVHSRTQAVAAGRRLALIP